MSSDVESRFWQGLLILATLLTAVLPAYVAYDLFGKGQHPEKRLELQKFTPINPMEDLSVPGKKITLSLNIDRQVINNLTIVKAWLHNVGTAPIVPSDYHEKISITVQPPWKIVAVENKTEFFSQIVFFKWKRISDNTFEAEPALLNPGDWVSTVAYLINTKFTSASDPKQQAKVDVQWKARITNMRAFVEPPDPWTLLLARVSRMWGIQVQMYGPGVLFTIAGAMLFQAVYLHFLGRSGLLPAITVKGIVLALGSSLLSFAAAESIATYLFMTPATMFGVQHGYNLPWIILHVGVLVFLFLYASRRSQSQS